MHREYVKWFSARLGRDMELLAYGHAGSAVLVFPTSMGRFYEYEDRGMIGAVAHKLDSGQLQMVCVDSVDSESWYNRWAHPHDRAARHTQYDAYIRYEAVPFVRSRNGDQKIGVTGCSFGGYHSVAFALRHPDSVGYCVSMSGAFDIKQFLHGYYDDTCYFVNPPDFLPNMNDPWYLERYREMRIVLATGDWDICLGENRHFSHLLEQKGIPHWLDVWGDGAKHDWPLWQRMAVKFF